MSSIPERPTHERVAAHIIVSGRVQGVGFRWFARDAAQTLDLGGWARNRRDGTVEVEVEGSRALIEDLARRLRQGPPAAAVRDVSLQWLPVENGTLPAQGPARFDIRPTG